MDFNYLGLRHKTSMRPNKCPTFFHLNLAMKYSNGSVELSLNTLKTLQQDLLSSVSSEEEQ